MTFLWYDVTRMNFDLFMVWSNLYPSCCGNTGRSCTAFACSSCFSQVSESWPIGLLGWLGEAKVLCILCHQGVQLVLAYSWARPAILVAGKGTGGRFLAHLRNPYITKPKMAVGQCVQPGQKSFGHLEIWADYGRWPTSN